MREQKYRSVISYLFAFSITLLTRHQRNLITSGRER